MNHPLDLCRDLEDVADKLDATPGTEANLQTIKGECARGFRAIAENIKSAYQAGTAKPVMQPPPTAPSEQPGNSDPAMIGGAPDPMAGRPGEAGVAASEGSTD